MLFPGPSWCMTQPTQGYSSPTGASWQAMIRRVPPMRTSPGSAIVLLRPRCFSAQYPFGMSLGSTSFRHGHFSHCCLRTFTQSADLQAVYVLQQLLLHLCRRVLHPLLELLQLRAVPVDDHLVRQRPQVQGQVDRNSYAVRLLVPLFFAGQDFTLHPPKIRVNASKHNP